MFDDTDPELEAKASGLKLLTQWAGVFAAAWCLVVAAYFFIARVANPALGALWRAVQ